MFTDQFGHPISAAQLGAQLEAKAKQIADQLIALEMMRYAQRLAVKTGADKVVCPAHGLGATNFRVTIDPNRGERYQLVFDHCCKRLVDEVRLLEATS